MAIDTANDSSGDAVADGQATGGARGVLLGACGSCRAAVAGDIAIDVEVALGELAAGIRVANAEVRRMLAASAGWSARGGWSSDHPSAWRP